jgi:predicted enzyme related to lactoylglutathione lyase
MATSSRRSRLARTIFFHVVAVDDMRSAMQAVNKAGGEVLAQPMESDSAW